MGNGPRICQMIGEPHHVVSYTDCLKCTREACPINMIYRLLKEVPELEYALADLKLEFSKRGI